MDVNDVTDEDDDGRNENDWANEVGAGNRRKYYSFSQTHRRNIIDGEKKSVINLTSAVRLCNRR